MKGVLLEGESSESFFANVKSRSRLLREIYTPVQSLEQDLGAKVRLRKDRFSIQKRPDYNGCFVR